MIDKIKQNIYKHRFSYLLVLIIIFGYFPVSFFLHPLKFGAIYFHYPWRYDIVESIRQGVLPLWYYNHHLGVPIYADPQSGAWYPFVWLFSLFGWYSLYSLHTEFILHIIIAGLGMKKFAKTFGISELSAFLISIVYVFSGIFSDNVLTSWTVSMAWLPFVGAFSLELSNKSNLKIILGFSLSLSMLILGGYPSFTIVSAYLIIIFTVVMLIKKYRVNKKNALKYLIDNLTVVFITVLITMVLLLSIYFTIPYIFRLQPVDFDYTLMGNLSIKSFVSLLLPYTTIDANHIIIPELNTYFTMSNSYFGIIPLIFVFAAPFVLKRKSKYLPLIVIALIFIIYSLGNQTFVYKIFYKLLPGFNLLRFANFVRVFFIMAFLIVSGLVMDKFFQEKYKRTFSHLILIFSILFFIIAVISATTAGNLFNYQNTYDFLKNINFQERIFLQSCFQFLLLFSIFILLKYSKLNKKIIISGVIIIDMLISFNLNFLYTGYAPRITLKHANEVIIENKNKISLENNKNILQNTFTKKNMYYFDFGLNEYEGKISIFGNGSFIFNDFKKLRNNKSKFEEILSNPVIYFAKNIKIQSKDDWKKPVDKVAYVHPDFYKKNKTYFKGNGKILNSEFYHDRVEIKTDGGGLLVLLQNFYSDWNVYVDNQRQNLNKTNYCFMSVTVPPKGIHNIVFKIENRTVKYAFYISSFVFILVLFLYLFLIIKSESVDKQ